MNRPQLIFQTRTQLKNFRIQVLDSLISLCCSKCVCCAHFKHNFCFFTLNYQVRNNKLAQMVKTFATYCPFISSSASIFSSLIGSVLRDKATKYFFKPINQNFVSACYHHICLVIGNFGFWITRMGSYIYSPFSINQSCKIGYFSVFIFFTSISKPFIHNYPVLNDICIIKNNINTWQRERLNPLGPIWACDSLNSDRQDREGDSKKFPRLIQLGQKSNRYIELISICQNQDPTLNEAAARLGQSMRETEDQLMRDMLASTASFINAVGGNNGDNPTEISDADVSDVIATLVGNDAHMILDNIQGEDRFATAPVRQSFIAMCHSDITSDLDNQLTGFQSKYNYANQQNTLDSEWGSFRNVRFLVSSVGSFSASSSTLGANVYNIFVAAKEAYACIYQDGASAQFIYRDPMYDGPLALNASVGYKMAQVPRLLNDAWLLNLRVTLSN